MKQEHKKLLLITLLLAMVFLAGNGVARVVSVLTNHFVQSAGGENWGLGFGKDGEAPTGNATPDELEQYDTYYIGDQEEKVIYLTFDAGYENGNMPLILDTLKKHQVLAAFFLVGNYLETSPDLVNRMLVEGHLVGNHTYHHKDVSSMTNKRAFEEEVGDLAVLYEKVTGQVMKKFYRPPQGKYSMKNLKMAQELGYKTVFWSLAYVDWYENDQPTKEEAFDKLLTRIHPGAVVLLHSTSKTNAEILDELLSTWKEMGYTFKTLEEL